MKANRYSILLLIALLLLSVSNSALAQPLTLTIKTDKTTYSLGWPITVTGNLTQGGTPVSNGLVTIQVNNPRAEPIILRTRPTGTNLSGPWMIEIISLLTCDSAGNPKSTFKRGGNMGFRITLRNNALTSYPVRVPIYIQYSDSTPGTLFMIYEGTLQANKTVTIVTWPVPISSTAPLGTTYAYANAINDLPTNNGYAYCPEKQATFTISLTTGTTTGLSGGSLALLANEGSFSMVFKITTYGGMLGNYTVNASSRYSFYIAFGRTAFQVKLIGDITGRYGVPDGKVDILDVALVSRSFGSYPGHPLWNPVCDVNKDGRVDITDVSMVSGDFGKWGILP